MSIFLQVPGVTGDSSDKNHSGWIDVDSMQWGSGRQISSATSTRGDRESSNAIITDLTLFKKMDKSTPYIFLKSCCGRADQLIIELTKTGVGQGADVYMQYILHHALFSSYKMRHKQSKNPRRAMEMIKISFTKLEMKYMTYDEDNIPLAPIAVGFDTTQNIKL